MYTIFSRNFSAKQHVNIVLRQRSLVVFMSFIFQAFRDIFQALLLNKHVGHVNYLKTNTWQPSVYICISATVKWKTRSRSSGVGVPESESRSRSPGVWRQKMENAEYKIWKTRSLTLNMENTECDVKNMENTESDVLSAWNMENSEWVIM